MPASRAAWTTAVLCSSSMRIPKLLHPIPTSVTSSEPSLRVSISSTFPPVGVEEVQRDLGRVDDPGLLRRTGAGPFVAPAGNRPELHVDVLRAALPSDDRQPGARLLRRGVAV